jgi:uncharacterized repeat protein (TIGR03803 family)
MKKFNNTKTIFIAFALATLIFLLPSLLGEGLGVRCFAQHNSQLWGMTASGGADNMGTLFHYTPASSTHTVDFSFPVTTPGEYPEYTELTAGANGKFYGMTRQGGANGYGVIFEWNPNSNTYLKKFDFDEPSTGSSPTGSLTFAGGKLYGMAFYGGANYYGVIFEWDTTTNTFTKKFDFDGINTGGNPAGSLTLAGGKLYGMTSQGGVNGVGVIFEWNPVTNAFSKKFDFDNTNSGGWPFGSLTLAGGRFYGMTSSGGANDYGVIFEWNTASNSVTDKFDFDDFNTGRFPMGNLTLFAGKLYGMTNQGGANDQGVIFEWDTSSNNFKKKIDFILTTKGGYPEGSLTLAGGKFYGMTYSGGINSGGVIFEWDTVGNTFKKKIDFDNATTGGNPLGSLTFAGGKFYGMTSAGGLENEGVIFEWDTSSHAVTKKIGFNESLQGSNPSGTLARSGDKIYGVTNFGGANNAGVIFEWDTTAKILTKKFDFDNTTTGGNPFGSLTLAGGKFYGMTNAGGLYNYGVIFEWDPSTNTYIRKFDFNNTPAGSHPIGDLILVGGKLYGMTNEGGANGFGVIFEWNPSTNTYTKKIDFDGANKGRFPFGSLTLSGGKLYGMTGQGGINDYGVIFEWNPVTNICIKKFDFDPANGGGEYPQGSLTLSGGKLYGMTTQGGANISGIIFEWDPSANIYTKKIDFDNTTTGGNPFGSLTLAGGKFYGMTNTGGASGLGVIFQWDTAGNSFTKEIDFNSVNGAYPNYTRLLDVTSDQPLVLSNLPGAQNTCMGTASSVTFTVTDADNDVPVFTNSSSNTTLLPNANISVINVGGNNYQVTSTPASVQTGTTTVTVIADDGYGSTASFNFTLTVTVCTGMTEQSNTISVVIFPNPFSSSAQVQLSGITDLSGTEIQLFNMLGEKVAVQTITKPEFTISRNNLQQGVYFYRISSRGEILKNGKLVVE